MLTSGYGLLQKVGMAVANRLLHPQGESANKSTVIKTKP